MVGRLIKGESYIPFYMETSQIYDSPRKEDGVFRTTKLTSKLKHLSKLDEIKKIITDKKSEGVQKMYDAAMVKMIIGYLKNPTSFKKTSAPKIPDGSPIGN